MTSEKAGVRLTIRSAVLIMICIPGICLAEWSQRDRIQESEQLGIWRKKLLDADSLHGIEKTECLAPGLRKLAFRMQFDGRDPETDVLFTEIQTKLSQVPGHAEYYRDRLLQAQETYRNVNDWTSRTGYFKEQSEGFKTLSLLPDPETVRVLGELLANDWVPPGNDSAPVTEKFSPLAERATINLSKFPIVDKPFPSVTRKNYPAARAAWRTWYEEIASGKRTFRFAGDPTEYDFNGPASDRKLGGIALTGRRNAERAAGRRKAAPATMAVSPTAPSPATLPIWALTAAGLVCSGAVWLFLKRRKMA